MCCQAYGILVLNFCKVLIMNGYLSRMGRLKICTIDTKVSSVKLADQVSREGITTNSQAKSEVSIRLGENINSSGSSHSCYG
jgi:uncharacterized protein YunC (DUF1805 family)